MGGRNFEREPIRERERQRRGRKRRRREARPGLSREQAAYEEARRLAAAMAKLARSFAQYVVVVGVLALVLRPVAWIRARTAQCSSQTRQAKVNSTPAPSKRSLPPARD